MKRLILALVLFATPLAAEAQTYTVNCRNGVDITFQMTTASDNKPLLVGTSNVVGLTCRDDGKTKYHLVGVPEATFDSQEEVNAFIRKMRTLFGGASS